MSSNVFTLDALREEADKTFAPVKIGLSDGTEVVLRSLLRMSKKDREAAMETIRSLNSDSDGMSLEDLDKLVESASKVIKLIAGPDAVKLLKELDGDLGLLVGVLTAWMGDTQPGEAQNSPT